MSGLVDKVKNAVGNHEEKKAQPGDGIERTADNAANQRTFSLNELTQHALSLPMC